MHLGVPDEHRDARNMPEYIANPAFPNAASGEAEP